MIGLCVIFGLVYLATCGERSRTIGGGSDYPKAIDLKPSVSYASVLPSMPAPGEMVTTSPEFVPVTIKGIKIFPKDPLRFDFIIDTGSDSLSRENLKIESSKLIKYFLASLTIPEEDLWVNLSPYEENRIVPSNFGITEMGRDLLAQDYMFKQITSSFMYPERKLGKEFWNKVYEKAYQLYGKTDISINTFNKVWVVPDKAIVYENGDTAFVIKSHLKVMLEEDYLALRENLNNKKIGTNDFTYEKIKQLSDTSSSVVKDVILPAIEEEVNNGKNFALLRQIYHSLVLASWFKHNLQESFLGKIYIEKNKTAGVDIKDLSIKEKIYK